MSSKADEIGRVLRGPYRRSSYGYDVPLALVAVWNSCGPQFQLDYPLDDDSKLDDLLYWWIRHGRELFPGTRTILLGALLGSMHVSHLAGIVERNGRLLTPLQELVLRQREDLRAAFDVTSPKGIAGFWRWWLVYGIRELFGKVAWAETRQFEIIHQVDASAWDVSPPLPTPLVNLQAIGRPDDPALSPDERSMRWEEFLVSVAPQAGTARAGIPIPRQQEASWTSVAADDRAARVLPLAAILLHRTRADLRSSFDLKTADGLGGLLTWFYSFALTEYPNLPDALEPSVLATLCTHYPEGSPEHVPPWASWLYALEQLTTRGQLPQGIGAGDLSEWWHATGATRFGVLHRVLSQELEGKERLHRDRSTTPARADVALVGYPRGEFGLGEDIRLLKASLQTAGIEAQVVRAPWEISARENAITTFSEADISNLNAATVFYVMPPFDTLTLLNRAGASAFVAERRIGFWQWELERFPQEALVALELVDEIWCHSEHSAKAFRAVTSKPVRKVQLPVLVPEGQPAKRADFGLPDEAFVVFTSFDGNSGIARKNPLGAIRAFQQAFPKTESGVRLIIKAMNAGRDSLWRECLRQAAADNRLVIIDRVMDHSDYYGLLRTCNAVLSLHRAEGFGRLMAEAMAIGVPSVASAYSGNLDFMDDQNSWLVPGRPIPILAGDYAFHSGQEWIEPDIATAAQYLVDLRLGSNETNSKIARAKATLVNGYSPEVTGRQYAVLLQHPASAS